MNLNKTDFTVRPSISSILAGASALTSQSTAHQQSIRLLCRKEAATYLGLAAQTLACWASSRRYNLPFVKIGRKAIYRVADLDAFIVANTHKQFAPIKGSVV